MNESNSPTFWTVCDDRSKCHCDWRTTIEDCVENKTMFYMYMINAILSATITMIGCALLFHRVVNKKLPMFDFKTSSDGCFIRPRPIESMLFFGIVFNALRAIDTTLLVTNALPNSILRAFLYELPWQFGLCAFACYLFGIAHTVSHSSKVIKNNWFKSSVKIDVLCTILITSPFITNNVCSLAAAIFAEKGDFQKAKLFTDILYFLWTAYCFILAMWILVAGIRLLNILNTHLRNQEDKSITSNKIINGVFKVKMIMIISVTSLFVFSIIKLLYGLFRVHILLNFGLSIAIASVWTFDGTAASLLVVITLLVNPKALTPLSPSSANGSSTDPPTYHNTKSNLANSQSFLNNESYNYTTATKNNGVALTEFSNMEDASKSLYQGGYPLSNVSSTNEDHLTKDQKKYTTSFIVSSNFEQSGISETYLVPSADTKTYNMRL